ncbi:MmcQ/YjbR family DNA-binding protein [Bryobacter aggregatus]|uniref:MmcQ/YjbR family DNA-binding protein n=1 Tax=Bryobacter aggregatus TaxID=360054 RepID=UPI0005652DA9|nr:MmcQ/YjbR family DNA-binding protein [Bryobacter aggregatus]
MSDPLERVRSLCFALPGVTEKLSHGEPTFFTNKRVFAMFANNHHNDGHIAVWLAAAAGEQAALIDLDPRKYFRPPYVGVKGWIGVALSEVSDEELATHLTHAWQLLQKKSGSRGANPEKGHKQ